MKRALIWASAHREALHRRWHGFTFVDCATAFLCDFLILEAHFMAEIGCGCLDNGGADIFKLQLALLGCV